MRTHHALLLLALLVGACSDPVAPPVTPATPTDPPSRRFVAETSGYVCWRSPEHWQQGVTWWRRMETVVQNDERDADVFAPGADVDLSVPKGAREVQTAIAAWMSSKYWIHVDRTVHVEIELVEGSSKRSLVNTDLSAQQLLAEGWHDWVLPLDPPAAAGARLAARATLSQPPPDADPAMAGAPLVLQLALQRPWFRTDPTTKPNVLLILIDTLRADHMSCYGYERPTTPHIDALARQGVVFETCTAPAPWTLPSHGSLFTSRSPIVHRAGVNRPRESAWGTDVDVPEEEAYENMRTDLPTWAELLSARGWTTVGLHSNPFLRAGTGIERGFQRWTYYYTRANAAVDLFRQFAATHAGGPWFAFVHMIDPHQPYAPPAPWDTKWSSRTPEAVWATMTNGPIKDRPLRVDAVRAAQADETFRRDYVGLYDGEIGYTDEQVGLLLADLEKRGQLANTIVILTSDHGEEFWEHGGYEHGHSLVEEVLHVPLIVVWPGHVPAGARVKERVSLIDLMPTVLTLLDVPRPNRIEGTDIAPTWSGKSLSSRALLSDTMLYGSREAKALYSGYDKLVARSGEGAHLYDLAIDPHEMRDVAAERKPAVDALWRRLTDRLKALQGESKRAALSNFDAIRSDLEKTGYTGFDGKKK